MSDQATEQSLEQQMIDVLVREEQGESDELPEHQDVVAQSETEETTSESEQEQEEPRKFTLKRESGDVEVSEDEIVELAMKGYDYTQKTQTVAEERRAIEAQAQMVKDLEKEVTTRFEAQQTLVKEYGVLENLNERIGQYSQVDWNNAYDTDPVQAAKAFAQYQQLMVNRQTALETIKSKQNDMQAQAYQETQKHLEREQKEIIKHIPDWNEKKVAEIRDIGKSYGFNEQELATIRDHRIIRALNDALKYKMLEKSKGEVTQNVKTKPPVVKPSNKNQSAERSRNSDLRDKLRKTGDPNLAAKLIENML